uniref:non-specific serine/threonine protein kinase n=1 Tax=Timema cristinae TaxID=61476 RepID=A0A7R9D1P6_TIMCR|nr:unnamed protein product [Timema cristinae]
MERPLLKIRLGDQSAEVSVYNSAKRLSEVSCELSVSTKEATGLLYTPLSLEVAEDRDQRPVDSTLGSTRFFKVARAKTQEGLIVVKVFAIHDPTLPLALHKSRLDEIRSKLNSAVNCLPFQKAVLTDKAGFIMREYVKYSLYDRISTRPFLTNIEKRWIAFQVLYALHQCHKVGLANTLVVLSPTAEDGEIEDLSCSTLLVLVCPHSSSCLSFTRSGFESRTSVMRFIKTLNSEISSQLLLPEDTLKKGDLTPAMDIFSAGCALMELFNEGHPPFDFSQLLSYQSGEYNIDKQLDRLEDPGIRKDISNIINILIPENQREGEEKSSVECSEKDETPTARVEGLVIITSLVTSCIRGLRHCTSKFHCLDILLELSAHTSDETILDRILPYIFYLVHDPFPRVRVRAIQTLTKCLALVKNVPCSDANVFPEYVLPSLAPVVNDEVVIVRAAYAENIAQLAETALRFLEHCQVTSALQGDSPRTSYETELQTLHEMIQQIVATLLTDPQNLVKQTLMENGITKLCVFFGKQKANDVLLSHMITFLNDKEDKQLRGSFFDCIVGVAAYVGWHSSPILTPLLQQGLTDVEEFVTMKAINAMTALTELGLLNKSALYDLLNETTCFLVHPNLWVRQTGMLKMERLGFKSWSALMRAIVGFVSAMSRTLNMVDVQCKVMAALQPYLYHPLIQVDKEMLLLNALGPPIPRVVYDSVIKCPDIDLLLQTLKDRQRARADIRAGHVSQYIEPPVVLRNLFRRLTSEGMTDAVEDLVLLQARHLKKIQVYSNILDGKTGGYKADGKIELSNLKTPLPCHTIPLLPLNMTKTEITAALQARKNQRLKKVSAQDSHIGMMNEEWQHMFGTTDQHSPSPRLSDTGSISPPGGSMVGDPHVSPQRSFDTDHSLHEHSYIQYRFAPCRLELRQLAQRKQELHSIAVKGREWTEQAAWRPALPPPGWRLRGSLVAHLHEHRGAINRLAAIPETPLFASCSSDGYIRIWDCGKMEGRNIANRSRQVYNRQAGALIGLTVCENNQSLASASQSGSVFVLRIEANSNKMSVTQSRQLDLQDDGCAVDVNYFDSGSQSVLVYATMYGSIVGWDLRSPGTAWKLDNDLKHGVITSFCLDAHQSWLTIGTSSGFHICWDLRFQLPISTIIHPTGARVRKVICHPTEQSLVLSSVQGNNEISMWNLETQFRQAVLWASNAPPLSLSEVSSHSVNAMYASSIDRVPFLFAGGTDMRLRYWDLDSPSGSYLAIPAANDTLNMATLAYKSRLIDGTNVVQELQLKQRSGGGSGGMGSQRGGEESPRPGPDQPQAGHHDGISEIAMCQASQCFLLSGSRDGVIKVWKTVFFKHTSSLAPGMEQIHSRNLKDYELDITLSYYCEEFLHPETGAFQQNSGLSLSSYDEAPLIDVMVFQSVPPTEIRISISPSSAVELNTTSALANYATEAGFLN